MKLRFLPCWLLILSAIAMGCQFNRRSGFVRIWADYNTLAAPAFYVEEQSDRAYVPDCLFKHRPWIDNRRLRPPRGFQDVRAPSPSSKAPRDQGSPVSPAPLGPGLPPSEHPEQDRLPPIPAPPSQPPADEEPFGPSESDAVPEPLPLPPDAPPSSHEQKQQTPWQPKGTPSDGSPSPPALFPTPGPPPLGPTARQQRAVRRSHFERPARLPNGPVSPAQPVAPPYQRPFGAWLFSEPSSS